MRKLGLIFLLILFFAPAVVAQNKAEVIKFDRLHKLIHKDGEDIRVINFWATWCGPCVKELPYFEAVAANNNNVDIYLVSLDFVEKLERVNRFISSKNIQSPVLLLDDIDYNSWINKVDDRWSGAIPATLLINPVTGKRKFIEKELQEGELEKLIDEFSN